MAHFAKLDENNIVLEVTVVNNDVLIDESGKESEEKGIQFLQTVTGHTNWKQTSYNGKFRGTYAGIGYTYNPTLDIFIQPQPSPDSVFDQTAGIWITPQQTLVQ